MKLHKISTLLFSILPFAFNAVGGTDNYPGLDKYVIPANRPQTPAQIQFSNDGKSTYSLNTSHDKIECHSLAKYDGEVTVILDLGNTRETTLKSIDGFTLSPDGRKIMVWTNSTPIYRHSFSAEYYIYDCHSRILKPLSDNIKKQQAPKFSPDSRMVAFFNPEDNNLYISKLDYGTQVAVTNDGKHDYIINGVPDWTYQEEFATLSSYEWAPDNLTLSFLKYNETDVPAFTFSTYRNYCDPVTTDTPYPGQYTYKYPVAGYPNSKVTLHSYDIETRKIKNIPLNDSKIEYIPRIGYVPGDASRLLVTTLNREQTRMEVFSVNPRSTTSTSLFVEESKAWLDPETYEQMTVTADAIYLLSSRSGYRHIYKYSLAGAISSQITNGNYDITAFYGKDSQGNIYFQSTATGSTKRVISVIDIKGKQKNLTPDTGTASASFNPGCSHCILNYSSSTKAPEYTLVSTAGFKKIKTLVDNTAYQTAYQSMPVKEFFEIPVSAGSSSVSLNAYIIRPADFTPSKRYPVILYQYSGPGSQLVLDRWEADWQYYYASKGYIVVAVDPRGTGGRGRAFQDIVYKNLGKYETADLIEATRYIATLPGVDNTRIGIHGWSYGGYETLMSMTDANSPFKAAVAVAPVTDWRYYDTVYTERYMTTPAMNESGYENSSPCERAGNMKGRLLIMSGTSDDNVHLYNTISFQNALLAKGLFCDLMLFPGMNHSINHCDGRRQVYAKMLDFFDKNL